MDSFLFALNAVAPIILTVLLGYLLKKWGFMSESFSKMANKLVFRIFLPAMLFLNVYKIENLGGIDLDYILYVVLGICVMFVLPLPILRFITPKKERKGVLVQVSFRSNYALIGMPLAQSLFGEEGLVVATLLSAVAVPLFNILAVISLSLFHDGGEKVNVRKILRGIVENPLIQSVVLGLVALWLRSLLEKAGIGFRLSQIKPVYTVLGYLSNMATPMALLVLGAQFTFSAVAVLRKEILFGTLMRTVVAPLLGVGVAYLFFRNTFSGAHFAVFVSVFTTPAAVSSVPMAQEMGADAELAGQLVVWTTLVSALSVFVASLLLRQAGVFL